MGIIIVVALLIAVIAITIQAWLLQLAFKIATKETPVFGDAFKTCFIALVAGFLIGLGLDQAEMSEIPRILLGIGVNIVVYAIVISMFISTDMKKALIISVIMSALGWLLILMLTLAVAGLNNATG